MAAWGLVSSVVWPAPSQDTFAETVDVVVVEVPVRVLRDGNPVRGLTRQDFEVFDRGRLQTITGFEVIDLLEPPRRGSPSTSVSESARPRYLLLTFDVSFSRPNYLMIALSGARRMLSSQLHPTDRVGVALYASNSGARLLVGFTDDRDKTELGLSFVEALLDRNPKRLKKSWSELTALWGMDGVEAADSVAVLNRLSRQVGLSAALTLSGSFGLPELIDFDSYNAILAADSGQLSLESWSPAMELIGPQLIDQRTVELESGIDQIRWMSEAMGELVTLLRGVPDPKHMLLFSQGAPTELLQNKEIRSRTIQAMDPMIAAFNATGWSLQAIDIEGIEDPLQASGIDAGQEAYRHRDDALKEFRPVHRSVAHKRGPGFDAQALFYLADETGGDLIESFNYIHQATEVVLENTSVTYLLSFQPGDVKSDGSTHPLEVRLAGAAGPAQIRHRPAYQAPKPVSDRTALEWSLEAAELVISDQSVAEFPVELLVYPLPAWLDRLSGPLVLELPGRELMRHATGPTLRLAVQVFAFGEASFHDLLDQQIQIDMDKLGATLERSGLRFEGSLTLPSGRHRIRVVLRLLDSGERFLKTILVDIQSLESEETVILPPVFVQRSSPYVRVRQSQDMENTSDTAAFESFSIGGQGLMPVISPEIAAEEGQLLLQTLYVNGDAPPRLSIRVLGDGGSEIAGGSFEWLIRDSEVDDGATRLLGLFRPTGLGPGSYSLEVSLAGSESQAVAETSASFTLIRRNP